MRRKAAHLGGVHEARVGNQQGLAGEAFQGPEDLVVPRHVGHEVMKGHPGLTDLADAIHQPPVKRETALARADVAGQDGLRRLDSKGPGRHEGRGHERRSPPGDIDHMSPHPDDPFTHVIGAPFQPEVRPGDRSGNQP